MALPQPWLTSCPRLNRWLDHGMMFSLIPSGIPRSPVRRPSIARPQRLQHLFDQALILMLLFHLF